ncbi:PaaX family transcriptional regulator C-terminal domain-containing protein [Streptomyces katsurahamanus]|uniref:Transcriptional regulator n=1 Tax=Streptomyces katsurahamanus TaxID=2577098 RepID=A0ABW9P1L2_9ACTN|nr:PaaX family transcriptional regulator C-terminal domain-containing protein [Streptomyces katsurahamanus]MQS39486.1 transcriptional regulator [Streptomyces katsurahamanus]
MPGSAPVPVPAPEIPTRLVVHSLVREDGTVDAGELYSVAGALGMSDQQVRLCIKRLVAEGRFTHEGRGRKALLRATAEGAEALMPKVEFTRYAYRQDRGLAPWDGVWHLFAFAIPESARPARDALRDTLLGLGAAAVQGGLYISANAVGEYVEAAAERLGVLPAVTFLTSEDLRVGTVRAPRELAAALWPVPEISERYDRLAALAQAQLGRLEGRAAPAETERLTMAITLAAEFTRAMEPDPLLPPELLPQPWAGSRARELADRCWTLLSGLPSDAPDGNRPRPRLFRLYADTADTDDTADTAGTDDAASTADTDDIHDIADTSGTATTTGTPRTGGRGPSPAGT